MITLNPVDRSAASVKDRIEYIQHSRSVEIQCATSTCYPASDGCRDWSKCGGYCCAKHILRGEEKCEECESACEYIMELLKE